MQLSFLKNRISPPSQYLAKSQGDYGLHTNAPVDQFTLRFGSITEVGTRAIKSEGSLAGMVGIGQDFEGQALGGRDLRGADLRGADLRNLDLRGINLAGADLSGAALDKADLSDAFLQGALLTNASLEGTALRNVKATGADFSGASLYKADVTGAVLEGITLDSPDATQPADLRNTYFNAATRFTPHWQPANVIIDGTTQLPIRFKPSMPSKPNGAVPVNGVLKTEADLVNMLLKERDPGHRKEFKLSYDLLQRLKQPHNAKLLEGLDLRGLSFHPHDLAGKPILIIKNLAGINLGGCQLQGVDFAAFDLTGSDLSGTKLQGAKLDLARLRGANLAGSDLTKSSLCSTDFAGADLTDAIVTKADLTAANLKGANLTGLTVTKALFEKTEFGWRLDDNAHRDKPSILHQVDFSQAKKFNPKWTTGIQMDATTLFPEDIDRKEIQEKYALK